MDKPKRSVDGRCWQPMCTKIDSRITIAATPTISPAHPEARRYRSRRKRLGLTVEALVHDNPKSHPLFTREALGICVMRLTCYGYFLDTAMFGRGRSPVDFKLP